MPSGLWTDRPMACPGPRTERPMAGTGQIGQLQAHKFPFNKKNEFARKFTAHLRESKCLDRFTNMSKAQGG